MRTGEARGFCAAVILKFLLQVKGEDFTQICRITFDSIFLNQAILKKQVAHVPREQVRTGLETLFISALPRDSHQRNVKFEIGFAQYIIYTIHTYRYI